MTTQYRIIPSLRLVYVDMREAFSIGELVSHLEDLAADEKYVPPMKKIVDFSNTEKSTIRSFVYEDYLRIRAKYEKELRGEHCVFVAPTDFSYGMGRVMRGNIDDAPLDVSVVRSLEEALALLEIAEEDFRAGQKECC